MAFEVPILMVPGLAAGADLTAKQYYFMELTAEGVVNATNAATDKAIGVLQNAPNTGQAAEVMAIGITKVSSDAALSAGALIGPSADGQADAKTPGTDTTEYVCGQVLTASGAAGGLATALICCANLGRSA